MCILGWQQHNCLGSMQGLRLPCTQVSNCMQQQHLWRDAAQPNTQARRHLPHPEVADSRGGSRGGHLHSRGHSVAVDLDLQAAAEAAALLAAEI